jgi:hypothetical protein
MTLSFSISSLRDAYARGLRVEDVIEEALRRIEKYDDPAVWISLFEAGDLLKRAKELDAVARGKSADALVRHPLRDQRQY